MKIYDNIWALKYVKLAFTFNIMALILTIFGLEFYSEYIYEVNPFQSFLFSNVGYLPSFFLSFLLFIYIFFIVKNRLIHSNKILSYLAVFVIFLSVFMTFIDFYNNILVLIKVFTWEINTALYTH